MTIGNVELIHECFPKHSHMGPQRMKEGKKTGVSMERSKAGTKEKRSPDGLNNPNQNTIIININCLYFIKDGKSG